jgi:hypothetical protein
MQLNWIYTLKINILNFKILNVILHSGTILTQWLTDSVTI